ncbi:DUF4097 family beta strand repeat-containing protein [Embleya scabrispora]|uniref:DUF4097 family beta strand repeat-containing protein n=1 Tax=Embleya scabrispora TaxID=159449 RepID=UPI0003A719F4|nr:DUF4097 family beta strand repeat-containing protein [Embleya scabrispora]MYS80424.1 DUF4097 family beta strand repeat protein [Streptomyces sp. SID5474]
MSARNRRLALLAPLVALPLVLTACEFNVDSDGHGAEKKTTSYDVSQNVRSLKVDSNAGNVKVTEADVKTVKVTEKQHYDNTAPTTTHNVDGNGQLVLDYDCASKKACFVAYEVTIPRGGAALDIRTDAGNVTLRDVTGTLNLHTSAGKIDGEGVTSAKVTAQTSAGSIDLTFTKAPTDVDAKTNAGRATVRVPGGQQYAADVSTTIGDTDVKVSRNDQSQHKVKVHTDAGQARLLTS